LNVHCEGAENAIDWTELLADQTVMPDLFISYSSHDRVWAERLYNDLKERNPFLDIFWDYISIQQNQNWRQVLVANAENTRNIVAIWSEAAKASNEVGPEIQAFLQNRKMWPKLDDLERKMFYLPLEGEYGELTEVQGSPGLRDCPTPPKPYDPQALDRGISSLGRPEVLSIWKDIVRKISDSVARPGSPVTLAILAMNSRGGLLEHLDTVANLRTLPGFPTLGEVLSSLGLTLPAIKARYGPNALVWKPYGTGQTVIDILQDLQDNLNRTLDQYQFHWQPVVDLLSRVFDDNAMEPALNALKATPAVLVLDPISLHNPSVKAIFDQLGDYFMREDAVVLSLSPVQMPGLEPLLLTLGEKGSTILKPYFTPLVPASGTFAGCGLNLGHKIELMRMVRHGLGLYYLRKRKQDEETLVRMKLT
jgi:hypothetical protein